MKLIEFQETIFDEIINMGMIDKINTFIANDSGDNNIYTEYVIELFYDLMFKINEQKKVYSGDINEFKVILYSLRNSLTKSKQLLRTSNCV
jgi:hypothetical protein